MTRAELLNLFRTTAGEIAEKDLSALGEDSVISQVGIDSLELLEVIGALEQQLSVRIPDDQLVGIQTVRQLLALVEQKIAAAR
jgi:acyl carrier protein